MECFATSKTTSLFQSTHPVRGGTIEPVTEDEAALISIHPPREGWDYLSALADDLGVAISTHPPREGWDP